MKIFCRSLVFLSLAWAPAVAQSPLARTVDRAVSCPKETEFERYATLLTDDVSAAILFYHDHGCVMLAADTVVRIDKGSLQSPSNHVCIRPVGSYECLWTFAGHVQADGR